MDGRWVLEIRAETEVESSCSPGTVGRAARALGSGPAAWAAEVARESEAIVIARMPELAGPTSASTVRRSSEACSLVVLQAILDDAVAVEVPAQALQSNRDGAQRNIPLDRILHAMWISHAHFLQRLLAFAQDELPPDRVPDVMRRTTELAFSCVEEFTARFTREYSIEQDAWTGSMAATRREIVEDLLACRAPTVRHPERALGVDLAHRHVGVVVRARTPTGEPDARLERVAREIVVAAAPPASLTVRPGTGTLWLWMSWPAPPLRSLTDRLRRSIELPDDIEVGVGPDLPGPGGFRLTHLAAAEAIRVAAAGRGRAAAFADYTELDVIALLIADPHQAAEFMRRQLGPLVATDRRTNDLRATLRQYLTFERSRVAAARVLHVAPNTVGYRIRQVEQLLGAPLPTDALRLRLALEIADYVDRPGSTPRWPAPDLV